MITEFLDHNGNHIEQEERNFVGNPQTGSSKSLENKDHSRRDDLESLAYTFMFIINKNLVPW
jgi:hypothetical protein